MASEAMEQQRVPAPPAPAGGGKDKLGVLVLGVVLLNTVAAAGMGYLVTQVWGRMSAIEQMARTMETKMQEQSTPKPPSAVGRDFVPQELGVLYPLDGFLVNITSDRGPRFLQMKLEMELDTPALEDEVALKRPALRDAIIVLLTSRTYSELRDPKGMGKLREELTRSVNSLLKSGQIKGIYFTQFHFN